MDAFDENSPNAMFAKILERLGQQDREARIYRQEIKGSIDGLSTRVDELKTKVDKTNGRLLKQEVLTTNLPEIEAEVEKTKLWRAGVKGKVAGIAIAASAVVGFLGWLVEAYLLHAK